MDTRMMKLEIGRQESMAEYEAWVAEHAGLYPQWGEQFAKLLTQSGRSIADVAAGCQVPVRSARKWLRAIPTKRDCIIALACVLGLDTEAANHLLRRYAQTAQLYVKNPDDAIWMYILSQGWRPGEGLMDRHEKYRQRYLELVQPLPSSPAQTDTRLMSRELLEEVKDDAAFLAYCARHRGDFANRYEKLRDFIRDWLGGEGLSTVMKRRLGAEQTLPQRLSKPLSEIRSEKYAKNRIRLEVPKRSHLIALGLHLDMPADQIDQMLELSGMEGLCPKDRVEGAILFALDDLMLSAPELFEDIIPEGSGGEGAAWASLEADLKQQRASALATWRTFEDAGELSPELRPYFTETDGQLDFEPESLAGYIRRRILESGLDGALRASDLMKYL